MQYHTKKRESQGSTASKSEGSDITITTIARVLLTI